MNAAKQLSVYDGITFVTNQNPRLPRPRVAVLKKPYRYFQSFPWGWVKWGRNHPDVSNCVIYINPRKHNLSISDISKILAELFDNPRFVRVASYDACIDLEMGFDQAQKAIWVKNKRRIHDKYETTRYHGGSHRAGEVKVYDKSLEQGLGRDKVTRIEQTIKFEKNKRPRALDFLKNSAACGFENVLFCDISKLDKRLKIVKVALMVGVQQALRSHELSKKQKAELRNLLKQNIAIDLRALYLAQLQAWLNATAARANIVSKDASQKLLTLLRITDMSVLRRRQDVFRYHFAVRVDSCIEFDNTA